MHINLKRKTLFETFFIRLLFMQTRFPFTYVKYHCILQGCSGSLS